MPLFPVFLLFLFASVNSDNNISVYIRVNQAGFIPADIKTAVVFSKRPLPDKKYFVLNKSGKIIKTGALKDTSFANTTLTGFNHYSVVNFTELSEEGEYRIRIKGAKDVNFRISKNSYNAVADSLIQFFRIQRCGPTDPLLHEPCHLSDATSVEGYDVNSITDVTGGWHDAGDFIKFLSTASYTTYMLLFSYEFSPEKFSFDNDFNGVPDVLEEARVGLDWLLRCRINNDRLITQVQDLRDHSVGWRLPENDSLQFDRPAFTGIGKNIIGIYSAALAMGARIWSSRFYDYDFAATCLAAAEGVYSERNNVPDVDKIHSGFYQDSEYSGKLALGAVELYITTKETRYLENAKTLASSAGSDFWWSWGNINTLAHYRLSKLGEDYSSYILNNLLHFNSRMNSSLFGEGVEYSWGTTNSMLGAVLQVILYNDLKGGNSYDSLAAYQKDYILGRNPWGVSFIYGIGTNYPRSLHSQIAYFKKGYLPGGLSAGPAPASILDKYVIKRTSRKYDQFNTGNIRYYDDFTDYITNEPTITGNATAFFVFGYYSQRGM